LKVILTAEAEADLDHISDYIAEYSARTALTQIRELRDKCYRLTDAPQGYPLLTDFEHSGIRKRPVGRYLILYRVNQSIESDPHPSCR
jgi:toxin ParE1/3/4